MAELTEQQEKELLNRCRLIVPDAEFAAEESWYNEKAAYQFEDSCGCYSEWTTESCSFNVWIRGTFDNSTHDVSWKVSRRLDEVVEEWVRGNLSFSGCQCCGEDSIFINVHLFPRK